MADKQPPEAKFMNASWARELTLSGNMQPVIGISAPAGSPYSGELSPQEKQDKAHGELLELLRHLDEMERHEEELNALIADLERQLASNAQDRERILQELQDLHEKLDKLDRRQDEIEETVKRIDRSVEETIAKISATNKDAYAHIQPILEETGKYLTVGYALHGKTQRFVVFKEEQDAVSDEEINNLYIMDPDTHERVYLHKLPEWDRLEKELDGQYGKAFASPEYEQKTIAIFKNWAALSGDKFGLKEQIDNFVTLSSEKYLRLKELQETRKESQELQNRIASMEQELENLNKKDILLFREREEKMAELRQLKRDKAELKTKISHLELNFMDLEQRYAASFDDLLAKMSQKEHELEEAEQEREQIHTAQGAALLQMENIDNTIQATLKNLSEREERLAQAQKEIDLTYGMIAPTAAADLRAIMNNHMVTVRTELPGEPWGGSQHIAYKNEDGEIFIRGHVDGAIHYLDPEKDAKLYKEIEAKLAKHALFGNEDPAGAEAYMDKYIPWLKNQDEYNRQSNLHFGVNVRDLFNFNAVFEQEYAVTTAKNSLQAQQDKMLGIRVQLEELDHTDTAYADKQRKLLEEIEQLEKSALDTAAHLDKSNPGMDKILRTLEEHHKTHKARLAGGYTAAADALDEAPAGTAARSGPLSAFADFGKVAGLTNDSPALPVSGPQTGLEPAFRTTKH